MKDTLTKNQEKLLNELKPKKRKNSRAKGNAFENQICKLLNKRFSTTEFSRSPGSGAFATTHSLPDHLKLHGDLITPKNFKFIVECKKGYNTLGPHSLLDHDSKIWEWITTLERDCAGAKKPGFILMAQDRRPKIVIIKVSKELTQAISTYTVIKNKNSNIEYIMLYLEDYLNMQDSYFIDNPLY